MRPKKGQGEAAVIRFVAVKSSCGCSFGSVYAFLLLQRARIFGSAFMLAYVYVFRLPSERLSATVGESRRISSCLRSPLHTHTLVRVRKMCTQVSPYTQVRFRKKE